MAHREPILEVEDLVKYYGAQGSMTKALQGISMTIAEGEFVGVMGPSGSGKTTLLNVVSTIDTPTSGRVRVAGKELTGLKRQDLARFRRERLGFIFQDFNLLDTLTLRENIALALSIAGAPGGVVERQVAEIARQLGIADALDKFPYQVSGGQKQRAAAARAMITDPDLILADEPTGSLDSRSAQMLLEAIADLNRELGATIMLVTHDPFAASYCQRILFINDGQNFTELVRGDAPRKQFFDQILAVLALLGGNVGDVR
jgi:putative ABC transport system ATP-binding protein